MVTSVTGLRCRILADCFKFAYRDNYDLTTITRYLMTSKRGQDIMKERTPKEYCSGAYMLEGIRMNVDVPIVDKTSNYDDYFAWYLPYLYKTWVDKVDAEPEEVYKIAPIEQVWRYWARLQSQTIPYGIAFLNSIYEEAQGK